MSQPMKSPRNLPAQIYNTNIQEMPMRIIEIAPIQPIIPLPQIIYSPVRPLLIPNGGIVMVNPLINGRNFK